MAYRAKSSTKPEPYRLTPTGGMLRLMRKPPKEDLDSLLEAWRVSQVSIHRSPRTINERAINIRALLEFTGEEPLKLTPEGIESFLARPGLKRNTRATYYASARAFSAWLVKTGRRRLDPTERLDSPGRDVSKPRPISEEQLVRILAACNRRRTRMMILLAAFVGLRVHEIAKIRGEDIDRSTGALTVTGKGGATKIIALDDVILAELDEWPRVDWWFPGYKHADRPVLGSGVAEAIMRTMKRAGVRATPHQLRHFYGTQLVAGDVNLRVVQELMRHASVASTQIYTGVSFAQQREALSTLRASDILAKADAVQRAQQDAATRARFQDVNSRQLRAA